eukprot:TRINITY_DN115192_c0_g1_i1.p1 TRINITY_DN115192_c0_g1~~TRINITY_DN115192_c0_g1_i1.p1  ORF type:complete len:196 (-),score=34.40 TRINITY_DN115192_c0_g1_i1:89-676(-)
MSRIHLLAVAFAAAWLQALASSSNGGMCPDNTKGICSYSSCDRSRNAFCDTEGLNECRCHHAECACNGECIPLADFYKRLSQHDICNHGSFYTLTDHEKKALKTFAKKARTYAESENLEEVEDVLEGVLTMLYEADNENVLMPEHTRAAGAVAAGFAAGIGVLAVMCRVRGRCAGLAARETERLVTDEESELASL